MDSKDSKDIDVRLYALIKKYDLYRYIPEVESVYNAKLGIEILNNRIMEIPDGKKIAVRGGGVHFNKMWNQLSEEAKHRISYIVDRRSQNNAILPTIDPNRILDAKIDVIIVSSWKFRTEFLMELNELNNAVEIIEPYELWNENGLHFYKEFFAESNFQGTHVTYVELNNTLKLYQRERNDSRKKYYLEKVIAQCIEIRDFVSAESYVEKYIESGWDTDGRISGFWDSLNHLLHKIEQDARNLRRKDIVINWIDNVNAEEFYSTDFVKKIRNRANIFMEAYTVTPWTHFTMRTVMTGKLAIDDETYTIEHFDENNSPLIGLLKARGYRFLYIANPGLYQSMFENENLPEYPASFKRVVLGERAVSDCSTRLQWTSLKYRLLSDRPECHLIHNLAEVHLPFAYTGIESMKGERTDFRIAGMRFIAKQLEWYEQFHTEEGVQIYLSDHGEGMKYGKAYIKGRTNIPFLLKGKGISEKEEHRLYSHRDFQKVIAAVLSEDENDWDDCFSDSVPYQNIDFYNENAIMTHIVRWMAKESKIDMANYQLRGIRTKEDLYVRYAEGHELYFRLPDETKNVIGEEKWSKRVAELRKQCPDCFLKPNGNSLFEHTHTLYEFLELLNDESVF